MKAVLFDLDNTLYYEMDFVKSGFRVIARYIGSKYHLDEELLFAQINDILLRDGRGKVFNTFLQNLGLYSEERVRLLVYLYRSHFPAIQLYDDAIPTLGNLRSQGMLLGIITDGMASVQKNKISALSLDKLFDIIICTDELGEDCWKPSTTPFRVALDLLRVHPSEAAYIGDDISKDFIGPNSLGMLTIQMKQGMEQNIASEQKNNHKAKFIVKELKEIPPIILRIK